MLSKLSCESCMCSDRDCYVVKAASQCVCAYLVRSLGMCLLKPSALPQGVFAMHLRHSSPIQCVFAMRLHLSNAHVSSQCICATQCVFAMRLRHPMRIYKYMSTYIIIHMLPPPPSPVIHPVWVELTELAHCPGCDASRIEDLTDCTEGVGIGTMPPNIPKDHGRELLYVFSGGTIYASPPKDQGFREELTVASLLQECDRKGPPGRRTF